MEAKCAVCCKMAPKSLDAHCIIQNVLHLGPKLKHARKHIKVTATPVLKGVRGCLTLLFVVFVELSGCGNTKLCACMYMCL